MVAKDDAKAKHAKYISTQAKDDVLGVAQMEELPEFI